MSRTATPKTHKTKPYLHLIYALYAFSFLVGGLSILIGVILAYIQRGAIKNPLCRSHYTYLIETAWSLLFVIIGAFLILAIGMAVSGIFMMIPPIGMSGFFSLSILSIFAPTIIWIWFLYRVLKGWIHLKDGIKIK